jgi:hypothetical protein
MQNVLLESPANIPQLILGESCLAIYHHWSMLQSQVVQAMYRKPPTGIPQHSYTSKHIMQGEE